MFDGLKSYNFGKQKEEKSVNAEELGWSPVSHTFHRGEVEEALSEIESGSGEIRRDSIDASFHWASTPQGHNFWSRVCYGEESESELELAKRYLKFLLRSQGDPLNGKKPTIYFQKLKGK